MNKRTVVAALLVVSIGTAPYSPAVCAGSISTQAALANDRERILAAIRRPDARAQLERMGVKPADVSARVAALTDAEAADLAARIDKSPVGAGGGPGGIFVGLVYAGIGLGYLVIYTVAAVISIAAIVVKGVGAATSRAR